MNGPTDKTATIQSAGFPLEGWCRAIDIGRTTYYTIPDSDKPKSVMIGGRRIIIEPPADYLARIEKQGGVAIPKRAA